MAGYENKLISTHCGQHSSLARWLGWPHHFDTQDSQFGSQGSEFGSQDSEFGSQGGSQDVVEEWLKEDEYRVGVEKKEKISVGHTRDGVEKIDK